MGPSPTLFPGIHFHIRTQRCPDVIRPATQQFQGTVVAIRVALEVETQLHVFLTASKPNLVVDSGWMVMELYQAPGRAYDLKTL